MKLDKIKRFDLKHQEYLVTCDLINKYSLKNIDQKPKIEKVTIAFNSIPRNSFFRDSYSTAVRAEIFSFFSKIFSIFPKISLSLSRGGLYSYELSSQISLSFKVDISDLEEINLMLYRMLILVTNNMDTSFNNHYKISLQEKKILKPCIQLLVVDNLLFSRFGELNRMSKPEISLKFSVKNSLNFKKLKTAKNISFFWLL
jgi:Cu/Ag efflux protein CusF